MRSKLRTARITRCCGQRTRAVAMTGLVLALASGASAQDDRARQEHDALFRQVMTSPGNAELNHRYAVMATQQGDYEAAIGALERVVFNDPDRARVRMDLGVLYFRLGSYDLAKTYFESALSSPDVTDDIENRIPGYLDEIARRQQTTTWSFSGMSGLRHQSNANAASSGQVVRAGGVDTALGREFRRKPDWNWHVGGTLRHVHDLENQRGDTIEAHLTGYYSRQFSLTSLNAGILDGAIGPRLALAPDLLPGWSIKPYVAGSFVTLGDVPYLASPGYGVSVMMPFETVLVEAGYEHRRRNFIESSANPGSHDQNGRYHLAFANLGARLNASLRWSLRAAVSRSNARADYQSNLAQSLETGLSFEFRPWASAAELWTLTPYIGGSLARYDQPNPSIDRNVRRRDKEWRTGLRLDAPVTASLGLGLVMQYSAVKSSLPNYRTHNFSVSFGPSVRF